MTNGNRPTFPVVGLGASAGGITALKAFFAELPADSGMAYVVVIHLDPDHSSHLADVLGSHAAIPVVDAEEGMPVAPDRVHVIPPNAKLSLSDGAFRLEAMDRERAQRRPIDHFFTSLAAEYGDWAIAAILSGTGSNGSAGLARIKEQGGLVAVQDPATAEYNGMPGHAVATGLADLVMPVERLPGALIDYARHDRTLIDGKVAPPAPAETEPFDQLMTVLRRRTGQDFRAYKETTVIRRVRRRMGLRQAGDLSAYLGLVREEPEEQAALARDLLINVTGFFRDPEAWQTLRDEAIAPLIADYDPEETLRVWVPGCASGEEAYSLAILLLEAAEAAGKRLSLAMFATDTSEEALSIGRLGVYPASAVEELAPERIESFFNRENDTYRVRPRLRDAITFAPQNLLHDPPFSRMDLISCRNVLIYLKPPFQEKLVALFHFALRRDGILFLGNVETPVGRDGLFEPVSKRWRVFQRIGATRHDIVDFPLLGRNNRRGEEGQAAPQSAPAPAPRDQPPELARRALLDRFAPPSVLVDGDLRVLYFHGETAPFLRHPDGEPTNDLMALLRDGLQMPVRTVSQAAREAGGSRSGEAWVQEKGRYRPTLVTAMPAGGASDAMLISFEEAPRGEARARHAADEVERAARESGAEDQQLQEDLLATREQLRMTVRQLEASNEDLKASNEEIMSMNEELQSANEELESAKEEQQSLNEELNTVNSQLQNKVQELESKSNDLNNLLNSTDTPTLFLDANLHIRWFTPAIGRLIELTPGDIGRPVAHFAHKYQDADFRSEAEAVRESLIPRTAEVRSSDGGWFQRRILPYRTEDNRIEGLVVTFTDISERKQHEVEIAEARYFAEAIVETVRAPLLTLSPDLKVVSANDAFYREFQVRPETTEGRFLYDLGHGQWDIPELRRVLNDILPQDEVVEDYEVNHAFPEIGQRVFLLNGRRLDSLETILLSLENVTDRRRFEERQKLLIGELNHRIKNLINSIQAIAWQTLRRSGSLEDFQVAFMDRVQALARCHDVLVQSGWHTAELSELVRQTLAPHLRDGQDEVVDACAGLTLKPAAALAVTMMLHELATNAQKYGALSANSGRLRVHCSVADRENGRHMAIIWDESGGPPARAPESRGFGMSLIEGTVTHELDGEISFDFREEGLRVEAHFPLK
ncbi:MAG: PAS domain-containing protein [Alphaproteobacteria bacterium]|jgi:two-component system CheB/CheR fusion protein|nr:PAS domain-containing protein [Alphaproteobacteria bacterium]